MCSIIKNSSNACSYLFSSIQNINTKPKEKKLKTNKCMQLHSDYIILNMSTINGASYFLASNITLENISRANTRSVTEQKTKYSPEQKYIFLSQSNCKAMKMLKTINPYMCQVLGSDRRKLELDDQTEMIRGERLVRKSSQRPEISLRQQRQTTQQLQSSSARCQHNTAGHYLHTISRP